MFRGFFVKTISFVGYTVQYGCVAHCAFEYIGEFVSVSFLELFGQSIPTDSKRNTYKSLFLPTIHLQQCSGPSMEPTITNHDVVFSERVSRHLCRIQKWVWNAYFSLYLTFIDNTVMQNLWVSAYFDLTCYSSRGDIVIAKSCFDPKMNVCKRVIGLEGDKVCTSGPSDIFKTHTYVSTCCTAPDISSAWRNDSFSINL